MFYFGKLDYVVKEIHYRTYLGQGFVWFLNQQSICKLSEEYRIIIQEIKLLNERLLDR